MMSCADEGTETLIHARASASTEVNEAFLLRLTSSSALRRKLVRTGESPQSSSCVASSAGAIAGHESEDDMEIDVVTLDPPGSPSELLHTVIYMLVFLPFCQRKPLLV